MACVCGKDSIGSTVQECCNCCGLPFDWPNDRGLIGRAAELCKLWEELARVADAFGDRDEAYAYRDCAKDLRNVLSGDYSCLKEIGEKL